MFVFWKNRSFCHLICLQSTGLKWTNEDFDKWKLKTVKRQTVAHQLDVPLIQLGSWSLDHNGSGVNR